MKLYYKKAIFDIFLLGEILVLTFSICLSQSIPRAELVTVTSQNARTFGFEALT